MIRLSETIVPPQWDNPRRWRRFIIAGAAIAAAIILTTTTLLALELRRQALKGGKDMVAALSKVSAGQMSQTFVAADVLLQSVRELAQAGAAFGGEAMLAAEATPQFQQRLASLQKMLPQIDAVSVLDNRGIVIAKSRGFPPPPPTDLSEVDMIRTLLHDPAQGLAVSHAVYHPSTHQWMLYLGRAILADGGKGGAPGGAPGGERCIGAATVGITIGYLEKSLSTVAVGPGGSVALISDDGRMIARWPEIETGIGQPVDNVSPPLAPSAMPMLATSAGTDGKRQLLADTSVGVAGLKLHVAVTQTYAAILKPWRATTAVIVAFALIALGGVLFLSRFLLQWRSEEARWRYALLDRERDLSKHATSLAVAKDQAERAQNARGLFLANISHELRTPLNAVLGFADCFRHEIFGPLGDPRYREFADDIHASGQHLLDIINNILDLTKVDTGKLSLFIDDIDVAELVRFSAKLVGDSARSGGVALDVRAPSVALSVRADPVRLRQILLNLLSNAIKFTPGGGTVSLSAERDGNWLALRVSDTGIGMTADEATKAMQPFYQVDSSITRRHQGTGLGLPLAKSLVDLHGGRMEIDSAPGAGTTIRVYLHMTDTAIPAAALTNPQPG